MARSDAAESDLVLIGRMGKAHGVQGEVKVIPETDDPEHFSGLETVYVGESPEDAVSRAVASVRFQQSKLGTTVVLKLETVSTREEAEALRGTYVFARESDLPPLDEDEFFLHDVIGLSAVTEQGDVLGTVADVMELPGQPVFVLSRPGQPDALVPAVPEFIVDVDLDGGRVVIRPIEGLLD